MADDTRRKVTLEVKAGLYVLRYVGSADARTAPHAFVRPAAASAGTITVIGAPGLRADELAAPGSSVVLVVEAAGSIEVSLQAFRDAANLDARFSLDLLASGVDARQTNESLSRGHATTAGRSVTVERDAGQPLQLDILAHVSRRGDITPDAQGWIAGPQSPSAIEGIEIRARGADVAVAAQFSNAMNPQGWSAWLTPGSFIGTRQKASPLTGLRLKLVGSDAGRFEIAGEALFLGSSKLVRRGSEVEFTPPGDLDPLVGLRLSVVERPAHVQETPAPAPSRVRVFR